MLSRSHLHFALRQLSHAGSIGTVRKSWEYGGEGAETFGTSLADGPVFERVNVLDEVETVVVVIVVEGEKARVSLQRGRECRGE